MVEKVVDLALSRKEDEKEAEEPARLWRAAHASNTVAIPIYLAFNTNPADTFADVPLFARRFLSPMHGVQSDCKVMLEELLEDFVFPRRLAESVARVVEKAVDRYQTDADHGKASYMPDDYQTLLEGIVDDVLAELTSSHGRSLDLAALAGNRSITWRFRHSLLRALVAAYKEEEKQALYQSQEYEYLSGVVGGVVRQRAVTWDTGDKVHQVEVLRNVVNAALSVRAESRADAASAMASAAAAGSGSDSDSSESPCMTLTMTMTMTVAERGRTKAHLKRTAGHLHRAMVLRWAIMVVLHEQRQERQERYEYMMGALAGTLCVLTYCGLGV